MKRKIFISIFALTLIFSLAACGENGTGNTNSDNMMSDNMMSDIKNGVNSAEDKIESSIDSTEAKISRDEAKRIALDHANVKEENIKNYHIDLDKDNGVLEYDIEFDHNGTEYDYEIDANTGDIREHSTDKAD